ncbi:MAG TPA: potassium channel family protein [Actinophytocola sp.]|uniref:potassium channel family protein n=1 Tax=Actinophytocola sp. TaxID=1872138 RepID=UPI002F953A8E
MRHVVALAVIRPTLTVIGLVALYYLLPVDRSLTGWTLLGLVGGLVFVVVVIVWEIRMILRSDRPTLQGIQALAISVPLFLLIFANVYYLVALNNPVSFTESLTRTDALYFTVTVFATVGFGDITPVTEGARILVTAQMVGNLLLIGVALRVVLTAVQHSRRRRGQLAHDEDHDGPT